MPVSDMIRLGTVEQLTPQQLADLALERDQAARRALRRNDSDAFVEAITEARELADLSVEASGGKPGFAVGSSDTQ